MNLNMPLVDAYNREIWCFGGQDSYATHEFKGYLVTLEWFIGARSTEPMMCIQSARGGIDAGMLGICLSSIGAYADPSGGQAKGAMTRCMEALATLGKAPLAMEARTLLDVILQFAPKLILMPPTPRDVIQAAQPPSTIEIEVINKDTGKTVAQTEV